MLCESDVYPSLLPLSANVGFNVISTNTDTYQTPDGTRFPVAVFALFQ